MLNTEETVEIPQWATELRHASEEGNCLRAEATLLRQCAHWLDLLEEGEDVFVNLRPDTDSERDYVRFDSTRIARILERVAGDLDQFSNAPVPEPT